MQRRGCGPGGCKTLPNKDRKKDVVGGSTMRLYVMKDTLLLICSLQLHQSDVFFIVIFFVFFFDFCGTV